MTHHALARSAAVLMVAAVATAHAQTITVRRFVDTDTPIPGHTGTFQNLSPAADIDSGNIAFFAGASAGAAASADPLGIFLASEAEVRLVADVDTPIPGGTGTFTNFYDWAVSGDRVVLVGVGSAQQHGVYLYESGTLRVIADTNTPIPAGTRNFGGFGGGVDISSDHVAFAGGSFDEGGVYLHDGKSLRVVVDHTTPRPGTSGTFAGAANFGSLSLDTGDVAFRFGPAAYAVLDGAVLVVADQNTTVPDTAVTFTRFFATWLSAGQVIFQAEYPDPDVCATCTRTGTFSHRDGMSELVLDETIPGPGGEGVLRPAGEPAALDHGRITFHARDPEHPCNCHPRGVYVRMANGELIEVAAEGDILFDETIDLVFGGATDGLDVTFGAILSDGTQGHFVASVTDVCGNGIVEAGEQCDDGNTDDDDTCLSTCELHPAIPTVSDWGLTTTALALLIAGSVVAIRRRRPAVAS